MAYWNKDIETMPAKELEALQYQLLKKLVVRLYDSSEFYHGRMKEAGVLPQDINSLEDIRRLPFMKKKDLRLATGMSTTALAKLGKNQHVSTEILTKICEVLDCDFCDIIELVKEENHD